MIDQLLNTTLGTPILALATTAHVGVLLLRASRNPVSSRFILILVPSLVLTASPWWFPTPAGLAAGLLLHLVWFTACERWIPEAASAPRPAASKPKSPSRPQAPRPPAKKPAPSTGGFVQVPVIGVFPETDDITTFRMTRPEGFDFAAGQFTSVRINIDGKPVVRCYSVSSAPEAAGYFEISVKRQGLMSGTLHASIRPGSMISVMPPSGGFSYPSGDDRPITLLAGGVGITPLMSMLRHAVHSNPTRPITMLYSVTTHRDIAFRDELGLLAKRHPQIKVVITATRGPHDTELLSGRIDSRMISEQVEDVANNVYMICGPGPMIEGMTTTLAELGVPENQIRSEAFEAAVASTAGGASQTDDETTDPAVEGFQLRLVATDATIEINGSETLLDACEAAGIDLPSACRAGVCGTCRARLVDGEVRCDSEMLDENDREDGYILPCVSWAESDCAMEA